MRSLVTGGAGFIGSHLAEHLLHHNNNVIADAGWPARHETQRLA